MAEEYVLIGYTQLSDEISEEFERKSWTTNKIGGTPLFSTNVDRHQLDSYLQGNHDRLRCANCSENYRLIVQIYCPVDDKPHDRVLYIFACLSEACKSQQWLVLRCMSQPVKLCPVKQQSETKESWLDDQDDWGDEDNQPAGSSAQPSSANDNHAKPHAITDAKCFRPLYLTCDDETNLVQKVMMQEIKPTAAGEDAIEADGETYEKSLIPGTDEITHKFSKRLLDCPYQCVRYSWTGSPILNRSDVNISATFCEACGAERVFELQLMPALVNFLRDDRGKCDIDIGTVLIYTCGANCDSQQVATEHFVVLEDPDNSVIEAKLNITKSN